MTHYQVQFPPTGEEDDAISALVRLKDVLALVRRMADDQDEISVSTFQLDQHELDGGAAIASAYAGASSIARRRFDALAQEAACFAAAGLKALIEFKQRTGRECAPAARQLAEEMDRSIAAMARIITSGSDSARF